MSEGDRGAGPRNRPRHLTLQVEGAETVVPLSFSAAEFEVLDLFVEQCDSLARSEWVKRGVQVTLSLRSTGGVLASQWEVPSEEMTAAVLHRMRPFLLEKERATFLKIAALVKRRIPDPQIRHFLKLLKRRYLGKEFQSTVSIQATGATAAEPDKPITATLNSFEVFLEWLNAYEYHRDPDKRQRLEGLTRMLSHEAARAIFLHMLADAISAVFGLGNLVAMLTGAEQKLTLTGRGLRLPGGQREAEVKAGG